VRARSALLDALDALGQQRRAIVVVGAQAIYFHTGEADFAVSPYTSDADLALAPSLLLASPDLAEAMGRGGFTSDQPGIWKNAEGVQVDLLVPEALGGEVGRRGAQLPPPHGRKVARKVRGLEAALIDNDPRSIGALDPADSRKFQVAIAGSAALLVAKLHKIAERVREGDLRRVNDKDGLDVLRLGQLAIHSMAGSVVREALDHLRDLFFTREAPGTQLAVRATAGLEDPDTIAASCSILATDLLASLSVPAPQT
jgi:hypothetical protein